jgi:hypothetical protein
MHLNNINETNKREMLCGKDTRTLMCARRCVRACACARRCVHVRVCVGEGFRFAFLFAWVRAGGCVRVCVCACGWGGVQGRPYFWARARAMDLYDTPGTQRDKLFATPLYHEHKGISCLPSHNPMAISPPTNPRAVILYHEHKAVYLPHNPRVIPSPRT